MPNRNVKSEMWTDPQIFDNFNRTDINTWLYLLTSPNTLLCGVVKGSLSMMSIQAKMSKEEFIKGIENLEHIHKLIKYDNEQNEILILNWHKHNWTSSEKLIASVRKSLFSVKNKGFIEYVENTLEQYSNKDKKK